MGEEHQDSQQEPTHDSALQTPQPDQKHPPVSDDRGDSAEDSPPVHVEVDAPADSEGVEVSVDNPAAPGSIDGDASSD